MYRSLAAVSALLLLGETGLAAEASPAPPVAVHAFWDTPNLCLFGGVFASRALDYTSTQAFRARGLPEILLTNHIVDNKPLFATIEVGGAALSVGVSYFLHAHAHHRLERALSVVHIGITTFGAVRNYGLRRH